MSNTNISKGGSGHRGWQRLASGVLIGALLAAGLLLLFGPAGASRPLSPSARGESAFTARLEEGSRLVRSGQAEKAAALFRELIAAEPGRPEAYNNLAALLALQGDLEAARQTLEQALLTDSSYATVYQNLGVIYAELARDSYGKALRLEGPPPSPHLQLLTGAQEPAPSPAPVLPAAPEQTPAAVVAAPVAATPPSPPMVAAPVAPAMVDPPSEARAPVSTQPAPAPAPPPAAPPEPVAQAEEQARQALLDWAKAWSKQDVDGYLRSYSALFRPGENLSRRAWEEQRRQRLLQPNWIEVDLKNLRFLASSEQKVRVELLQVYRSSHFSGRTRKRFDLVRENGQWRIASEQSL